jgi:hypothetical protein
MREPATCSIAVVCEADADRRTACALSDRVLREAVDWIVPETIEHLRHYCGIHDQEPYLKWTNAKAIAQRQRVVAHLRPTLLRGATHGERERGQT